MSLACRHCGAALTDTVADLGESPLANRFLRADQLGEVEPHYPLVVYVCARCFLVQLPSAVTPDRLFADYAYFSSYSDSWLAHARGYATAMTSALGLNRSTRVVEIGSNDGYLLQFFQAAGVPVLGVEPAANVAAVAQGRGIESVVQFFGAGTARELVARGCGARLVIANNVLAHVPDLHDFVEGLRILLQPGGTITLECPHLLRLMAANQFDTIYHEHFSYFSLATIRNVLAAHGLAIADVEELPTHGGSLRVFAKHAADVSAPADTVCRVEGEERAFGLDRLETYAGFAARVRETKDALVTFLADARRRGLAVAAYGAPAKGNTLLNYCGIGRDVIAYTVDRSPRKQGLFLPGTHIPILPPDRLRETRPDLVLILPWNLADEVVEQMSDVRAWGGRFVVPIPRVEVLA